MKRIMFIGPVGCGKTTLCQKLNDEKLEYKKTQTMEIIGGNIDTPGEYIENRRLQNSLIVGAADADAVAIMQDATADQNLFSPGHSDMFNCPVIGIVSKVDVASPEKVEQAAEILKYAGIERIFYTPGDLDKLKDYLNQLDT